MTAPDWLTPTQRAACDIGASAAAADCAALEPPTVTDVSLDRGSGHRTHIRWCLIHGGPADQCCPEET